MPRHSNTATIAQANDAATLTGLDPSIRVVVVELDSTTAALNVSLEATWDGTVWDAIAATRIDDPAGAVATVVTVGNSQTWRYRLDPAGAVGVRARCSAFTSGSCTARIHAT